MTGKSIDLNYVYFILNDEVEAKSKNGWCVSERYKIIDMCKRGFFTGNDKDFPKNADFTPWQDRKTSVLQKRRSMGNVRKAGKNGIRV